MSTSGPAPDGGRHMVVERNLAATAFGHLTTDAFMTLPFEALAPTKGLLKRYFSTEPWSGADDDALAEAVGPGEGWWRRDLDAGVALEYGWQDGRFTVRALATSGAMPASPSAGPERPHRAGITGPADPLAGTFDGPVVPEATPNPRTIRFQVGPIHDGDSRWYETAARAEGDPSAARLFAEFPEVQNVLVGPDFVAVGLHRPADWEQLLRPVLAVVTDEYAVPGAAPDPGPPRVMGGPAGAGAVPGSVYPAPKGRSGPSATGDTGRPRSRLQQAWREMGPLRPADAADLAQVRAAAAGDDAARRQVAASLLREADPVVAADDWARLAVDPVRSVRRAAVDAVVDVGREELRPLLEGALGDTDAWVRWKALRGLAELGAEASREAVTQLAEDADFRVRLEVVAALRPRSGVQDAD